MTKQPGHILLHALVERLALAYRGSLSDPGVGEFNSQNLNLKSDTRTRLALIEDCIKAADKAVDDPLLNAAPRMLEMLKRFLYYFDGLYGPYSDEKRDIQDLIAQIERRD